MRHGDLASDGGDIDNTSAALTLHVRHHFLNEIERTPEMSIHGVGEILRLHMLVGADLNNAGIVDQNVDSQLGRDRRDGVAPAAPISASLIGSGRVYRDVRSSIRNLLHFSAIRSSLRVAIANTKTSKRYARELFVTRRRRGERGEGNKISRHSGWLADEVAYRSGEYRPPKPDSV